MSAYDIYDLAKLREPVMLAYNAEQINAERRWAAYEIERLRTALDFAVDLLCGARSGHIGGSQPDCEWDSRKDMLLKDYREIQRRDEQKAP